MSEWTIYLILNEFGEPDYVGATNSLDRRMREHKKALGRPPKYVILQEGEGGEDRSFAEHDWIERYRGQGFTLRNRTAGGNGCQTHSPETRRKLSEIGRGRPKPEGFGKALSAATKGKPKNWSPEGRERSRATQFKKGGTPPALAIERTRTRSKAYWASIPPEARSAMMTEKNNKIWAARTPEQRSAIGSKIAAARARNLSPERLSEIASQNAKAAFKNPDARRRVSEQIKNWWTNMTPEEKADYLKRRTERIAAAKRAKKLPAPHS